MGIQVFSRLEQYLGLRLFPLGLQAKRLLNQLIALASGFEAQAENRLLFFCRGGGFLSRDHGIKL